MTNFDKKAEELIKRIEEMGAEQEVRHPLVIALMDAMMERDEIDLMDPEFKEKTLRLTIVMADHLKKIDDLLVKYDYMALERPKS